MRPGQPKEDRSRSPQSRSKACRPALFLIGTRFRGRLSSLTTRAEAVLSCLEQDEAIERARYRERWKCSYQRRRVLRRPSNGLAPWGYELKGKKHGRKYFQYDRRQIRVMEMVARLKDEEGLSWYQLARRLWLDKVEARGSSDWSISRVRRCYDARVWKRVSLPNPAGGLPPNTKDHAWPPCCR